MTKQQAISLHLAKWLDKPSANLFSVLTMKGAKYSVWFSSADVWEEFTPFAATTEGRAQFAECVIKADVCGIDTSVYGPPGEAAGYVNKRLEIIYEATGGQPGQWEE